MRLVGPRLGVAVASMGAMTGLMATPANAANTNSRVVPITSGAGFGPWTVAEVGDCTSVVAHGQTYSFDNSGAVNPNAPNFYFKVSMEPINGACDYLAGVTSDDVSFTLVQRLAQFTLSGIVNVEHYHASSGLYTYTDEPVSVSFTGYGPVSHTVYVSTGGGNPRQLQIASSRDCTLAVTVEGQTYSTSGYEDSSFCQLLTGVISSQQPTA